MIQYCLLFVLCILTLGVQSVDASMGFSDTVALILGLIVSTIGILACCGKYARKLQANQY
jgi:hypothetical protein